MPIQLSSSNIIINDNGLNECGFLINNTENNFAPNTAIGDLIIDCDTGKRIHFKTGSSIIPAALTITTSNIGVGTTSPTSNFHIHTATVQDIRMQLTDSGTGTGITDGLIIRKDTAQNGYLWNHEPNSDLIFGTNNLERLRINANGNVGIGTNPQELLDIKTTNTALKFSNVNNLLLYNTEGTNKTSFNIQNFKTTTNTTITSTPSISSTQISGLPDKFMTFTYTTEYIAGSGQTKYTITVPVDVICEILVVGGGGGGGAGGSGIGGNGTGTTGLPGTNNTGSGGGGGWTAGGNGGSGVVIIRYKTNEGDPEFQLVSGSSLTNGKIYKIGIYNGSFQIKSLINDINDIGNSFTLNNGNTGIGTTNPEYKLHVEGTTCLNGSTYSITDRFHYDTNLAKRLNYKLNDFTTFVGGTLDYNASSKAFEFTRTSGDVGLFQIFQNGNYSAAGSLQAWSDTRIKKEINDIDDENALQMILAIDPKTYKYIDHNRSPERVYGFIAQQIRDVIPEAVKLIDNIIPNIYKNCVCEYNKRVYIELPIDVLGALIRIGDGGLYKIILVENEYIEVDKYMESKDISDGEQFVYGYEVKDFHTINKEYIYTLNVCATQILSRKIDEQQIKINDLEIRLARLEALNS